MVRNAAGKSGHVVQAPVAMPGKGAERRMVRHLAGNRAGVLKNLFREVYASYGRGDKSFLQEFRHGPRHAALRGCPLGTQMRQAGFKIQLFGYAFQFHVALLLGVRIIHTRI